jgi:phage-related protein
MFNIWNNSIRKKIVVFDFKAYKEYKKLPEKVKPFVRELIQELENQGKLNEPDGKKIKGSNLFEIRVKCEGIWRGFYAYIHKNEIVILSFFHKKTQKTPLREIEKANKRLKKYIL